MESMGVLVAVAVLVILVLLIAASCVKIVPQAHAAVIERLGGYLATWGVGIHFKAPFIDRIAKEYCSRSRLWIFHRSQ